jgi:hypothetical protein
VLLPLLLLALPLVVGAQAAAAPPGTPSITLGVSSGPPGTSVAVRGTGFTRRSPVQILFDTTLVAVTTANGAGMIRTSAAVPPTTSGLHQVCAAGTLLAQRACAPFTVTGAPALVPTPAQALAPPPLPSSEPTPVVEPSPTFAGTSTVIGSSTPSPTSSSPAIAGAATGGSGGSLVGALLPALFGPILALLAVAGIALYVLLRNRGAGGRPPPPGPPGGGPQSPGPPEPMPEGMTVVHRLPTAGPAAPPNSGGWVPPEHLDSRLTSTED